MCSTTESITLAHQLTFAQGDQLLLLELRADHLTEVTRTSEARGDITSDIRTTCDDTSSPGQAYGWSRCRASYSREHCLLQCVRLRVVCTGWSQLLCCSRSWPTFGSQSAEMSYVGDALTTIQHFESAELPAPLQFNSTSCQTRLLVRTIYCLEPSNISSMPVQQFHGNTSNSST